MNYVRGLRITLACAHVWDCRMSDYNLLTEKLFQNGYTKETYPDYIHQFLEYSGGFVYKESYVDSLYVKLPCGMVAKARHFFREMSCNGVDYCFENNNPVFVCPFGKDCCHINEDLRIGSSSCFCCGVISTESYSYENSFEKKEQEQQEKKDASFLAFSENHKGRVCEHQCKYDAVTDTWQQDYNPMRCIRNNCSHCTIKNAEIDCFQKGNIYYELERTYTCRDGSLFDGEQTISVTKGIPFFERSYPLSILEDIVRLKSEDIVSKVMLEKHYEMYMLPVTYRVLNISAKKKVTRDLLADLEDVAAGKHIVHDSDLKRSQKEWKKKNKELREQKAKQRLINMLMDGLIPTELFSADYKHMISWFSKEQIEEYIRLGEEKRMQKDKVIDAYTQLSLFY